MMLEKPICFYCSNKLKLKVGSLYVFNGFYDKDTNQIVCMKCRTTHYKAKKGTKFEGLYAEFPITKT